MQTSSNCVFVYLQKKNNNATSNTSVQRRKKSRIIISTYGSFFVENYMLSLI